MIYGLLGLRSNVGLESSFKGLPRTIYCILGKFKLKLKIYDLGVTM